MPIQNHAPIYAGPQTFIQSLLTYFAQFNYYPPTLYDVNGMLAMTKKYVNRYKYLASKDDERVIFYIPKEILVYLSSFPNVSGLFAIFNIVDPNDNQQDYRDTINLTLAPFTTDIAGNYRGIKDAHNNIISMGLYSKDNIGRLSDLSLNTNQILPYYFSQRNIDYNPNQITGPPGVISRIPGNVSSNELENLIEDYCKRVDNYVGNIHHPNEFSILLIDIGVVGIFLEMLGSDEGVLAIKGVYEDETGLERQTTILCPCDSDWQAYPLVPGGGVLGFQRWPPEQTRSVADLLNGTLSQNVNQYLQLLNLD